MHSATNRLGQLGIFISRIPRGFCVEYDWDGRDDAEFMPHPTAGYGSMPAGVVAGDREPDTCRRDARQEHGRRAAV